MRNYNLLRGIVGVARTICCARSFVTAGGLGREEEDDHIVSLEGLRMCRYSSVV